MVNKMGHIKGICSGVARIFSSRGTGGGSLLPVGALGVLVFGGGGGAQVCLCPFISH